MEQGIVRFLKSEDPLYEGAYLNKVRFIPKSEKGCDVWPLWLIHSGYLWEVRKRIPAGGRILELGCAGGSAYFAKRYQMIGLDLSYASLRLANGFYDTKIQADVAKGIPLPDQSVDAVISSYFWEHTAPAQKPEVLGECKRVLKPGGKLIFLYDVTTLNPLIHFAKKRNPDLYRKLFLDKDGHLGYQTPKANKDLFLEQGFKILEHKGMEKTVIQSPSVYEKLQHWNAWLKGFSKAGIFFTKPPWFYGYTAFVRIVDETIGRLLPITWSRVVMSICEKSEDKDIHRKRI